MYRDDFRVLAAKDKISRKNPTIDLTPLEGARFGVELDRFAAKALNGVTLKIVYGSVYLTHKIAHEGGAYRMDADFEARIIQAIY